MIEELVERWLVFILLMPWMIVLIALFIGKRKRRKLSTKKVADWMTLFVMIAVYALARTTIGAGVGYYMMIGMLVIAIIYTSFEWRRNKDFMIIPTMYKIWRLLFLILFVLYFVLLILFLLSFVM